jgi:hypothetical protein
VFSEVNVDSDLAVSKHLPLGSAGNISRLEGPVHIDSKKGQGRANSAVKKMISAFKSSSPQVLY